MRVVLLGDSIRMGYQPKVAALLAGRADVIGSEKNGGDSANLLANFDEMVARHDPGVVHFNCGLHDIKETGGKHQVEPDAYAENLRTLVEKLQATGAALLWATTTPVLEERHQASRDFARYNRDIDAYNEIARGIMDEAGIPIDDLAAVVRTAGPEACLVDDGVHFNDHGKELLAAAVAAALEPYLDA